MCHGPWGATARRTPMATPLGPYHVFTWVIVWTLLTGPHSGGGNYMTIYESYESYEPWGATSPTVTPFAAMSWRHISHYCDLGEFVVLWIREVFSMSLPLQRNIHGCPVLVELKSNTGHLWRVSLFFVKINFFDRFFCSNSLLIAMSFAGSTQSC
jgi:hypothetical protein